MRKTTKFGWVACLIAGMSLSGCVDKKSESEELAEQAKIYWEAMRINDLLTIYQMETPALDGRLIAADMRNMLHLPSRLLSYEMKPPVITGNTATIELDLTLTKPGMKGKGYPIAPRQDHWTKIDGKWYHGQPKEAATQPVSASPESAPQGDGASPVPSSAPGDDGKS